MTHVSSAMLARTASASAAAHTIDHADPHVERAVELVDVEAGGQLAHQPEQRRDGPRAERRSGRRRRPAGRGGRSRAARLR